MTKSTIRNAVKTIGAFVVIVPTVLLVLAIVLSLALVTSPFWVPYTVARHLWLHGSNRGRTFLVVTRRHGWFDFIINNVVPVPPPGVELVWQDWPDRRGGHARSNLYRLTVAPMVSKPYLAVVRLWRNEFIRLHSELESLKRAGSKRSLETQARVREILQIRMAR